MSRCRFCSADIDWIWVVGRGYVPVDPEPVFVDLSGGAVEFITDEGGMVTGRMASNVRDPRTQDVAFIPHRCRGYPHYTKNVTKKQENGGEVN